MLGGEHDESRRSSGKYQTMRLVVASLVLGLVGALSYHSLVASSSNRGNVAAITTLKQEVERLSASVLHLSKQQPLNNDNQLAPSSPVSSVPNITATWIPMSPDDIVTRIVGGVSQSSIVQDIARGVQGTNEAPSINFTAIVQEIIKGVREGSPTTSTINTTALAQEIIRGVQDGIASPGPQKTGDDPSSTGDSKNKIPTQAEAYQFGMETPWGPNDAYYRCDNFHLAGDGLNLHQYHIADLLLEAICMRRNFVLPNFRIRVKTDIWLQWTDLFKWREFSNAVHEKWGIWLVPPELVPPALQVVTEDTCAASLNDPSPRPGASATVFWRPTYDRNHDTRVPMPLIGYDQRIELFSMMMHHLHPAQHLEEEIERLIAPIGKDYVCLHLRTEPDWVGYFKRPNAGYITLEQTARRFEMTKKHYDTTKDPKYHELFLPNQTLYVAGEHPDEYDIIKKNFGPYYARVVTKEHLGTLRRNYTNTERALIEREICSRSHVFILNKFSQWSEWVYYAHNYRYYPETGKWDFGSKDERDKHNFRVNPNVDNESPDITFYTGCLFPTGMPDMSGNFGLNC